MAAAAKGAGGGSISKHVVSSKPQSDNLRNEDIVWARETYYFSRRRGLHARELDPARNRATSNIVLFQGKKLFHVPFRKKICRT